MERAAPVDRLAVQVQGLTTRDYEQAWDEWSSSGEAELWEITAGDGILPDAAR